MSALLLIEDDADVALTLRLALERAGHLVFEASDGRSALRRFHERRPDVVLLDLGLPDLDGWQVLERIRDLADTPILIITARGLEAERVRGLQAGADDYLVKPFSHAELVARVEALLRRVRAASPPPDSYADSRLVVDPVDMEVTFDGRHVELTGTEFRLLLAFVRHPGQVLSPYQLLDDAWRDSSGVAPNRVKFAVARLRRKMGWSAHEPIAAVRGTGYRFRPFTP